MKDRETSILIVDDESSISALLVMLLGDQFHCQAADSAAAAMRLLDSQFFHLVLADIGLPGISGLELCRRVAALSPRSVVVLVSGKVDPRAAREAREAGAFAFLSKPFDLVDVLVTVERALAYQVDQAKSHSVTSDSSA
jgi:DNA-binding NtrC family response regulator